MTLLFILPMAVLLAHNSGPHVAWQGEWDQNENKNLLSWNLELDNMDQSIYLERSIGNTDSFHDIGEFINDHNLFHFIDDKLEDDGIYYYRLRIERSEGEWSYSNLLDLEVGMKDEFEVISIPNHDLGEHLFRLFLNKSSVVGFSLFNEDGQRLKAWRSQILHAGQHDTIISLRDIPKGKYLFKINIDHKSHKQLLVKG